MIQSILDNDLYKFTMQQAVHMLYPRAQARYRFTNRGCTVFPDGFAVKIMAEIEKMADLRLSETQKKFLEEKCYFLTPVYLDFLSTYRYDPSEVKICQDAGRLSVKIQGPWYRTILWEVPLMAIISETFFNMTCPEIFEKSEIKARNLEKAGILSSNGVRFADFGTRRRFSAANHEQMIKDFMSIENSTMIGTSNVHFAHKFGMTPIGTLAHEWFMFHAVLNGYKMANSSAQDAWVKVFRGDLGIALADTFTTDVFLAEFDTFYAKLFDGVRQDSGDPYLFVEKLVRHYERLHIDPATKTIVFSDGLDVRKAVDIHGYCRGRIRDAYGIGTSLTNDVGVKPLNMVIKLSQCRPSQDKPWQYTVKLSDDATKHTGNSEELKNCMNIFHLDH